MSDDLTIPRPVYGGARRPRRGMEPGTRRLLMIAGGLAGGLVVVIGASSMVHRQGGEIPVVQADDRPIRVKPDNPGGLQVANANNEIFSGGSDTDGSKLAPAPELPDPNALRAPPPAAVAPVPTAPVAAAPMTAAPAMAMPAAAPQAGVRLARPTQAATERPAAERAAERPAAPPATSAAAAEKHAAPPQSGKGAIVQLAALTTEDAARSEWQHLEKRMPELLGAHQPNFSRIERDGHTFWRVRATGFADVAQARQFCEQVRAKGGGCSVADF